MLTRGCDTLNDFLMPATFLRVLIVTVTLNACSGPSADDDARGHGGTGGTTGGTSAAGTTSGTGANLGGAGVTPNAGDADGGGTGGRSGSGSGSDGGGMPPAGPSGAVVVSSFVFYPTPTGSRSFAYARFRSAPAATSCPTTRYGACWVSEVCADEPPPSAPHAGLITVLSGEASFSLELPANAAGVYPQWSQSGAVFTGGESLSISAAGGAVPAFSRELSYPLLLLVNEPTVPAEENVARAPRSADLTLRWDRGTAGVMFQVQSQNAMNTLACALPSELGTLTIPAAALGRFDTGAELLLLTVREEHVQAGDFDVSLMIAGVAVTPDKRRRASIVLE